MSLINFLLPFMQLMNSLTNILINKRVWIQVGNVFLLYLFIQLQDIDCLSWNSIACQIHECCDSPHIQLNLTKLKEYSKSVYGQHLVMEIIESHLEAHFDNEHIPPKPLVLSFHGGTGTGKNYVANFIVDSIYHYGRKSKFVHYYHSSKKFPHAHKLDEYTKTLQADIETSVATCERSIFIFDEFDHMPPGLIDQLKVYLDFHDNIEGVNYRKSVFIFLTNTGEDVINDFTFKYHDNGGQREKIKLSDIEHHIARNAHNTYGGFHKSQLIDKHLVTAYVPFLPLLKRHVKMCIIVELQKRHKKANEHWIEEILNELHFVKGFSESGCKRIQEKVAFIIVKKHHNEL